MAAKKCINCGKRRSHSQGFDVCNQCADAEREHEGKKAIDRRSRENTRERVRRYRERKKATGEVDKSHGRARWDPKAKALEERVRAALRGEKAPPPELEDRADVIAAAETAMPLRPSEKRSLTIEEAAQIELARRELARRKLIHFIQRRNPKYLAGWVHHDICERLERFSEAVARGESPRLMLFMPPRHGKSEICSRLFPAWHLGKYPDHEFIACSYSETLALDFSRKVQEVIEAEDYEAMFETRIKRHVSSMERWETTAHGAYTAAGVGGPITGRGAHVLVIDDPIKNREDAESATHRQKIKDWYTSTAYSRLMPGGGVLIIQTRWHDDDLAGWLITEMQKAEKAMAETGEWPEDADRWEIVSYPAIAVEDEKYRKKGEALHPARYPLSALLKIRRTLGGEKGRDWNALYQQNPVPDTGEYFTKEMIREYTFGAAPSGISIITACDLAISKEDHANYTVFITAGVDEKDDIYVLDARRGRWDSMEIVDELINVYRTWKPQLIGIEKTHVEQSIGPFLEKRIREEKLWSMVTEPLPPGKRDKELRARPIQGRMRQGKVFFPAEAPWMEWLRSELLRFPSSPMDDGVDALAWIGQMLNMVQYSPPPKQKIKSWKDRLAAFTASGSLNCRNPAMAA